MEAKKEILGSKMEYLAIGCSVLEEAWIRDVLAMQNQHVLFLAEGLFMYLPQKEVEGLFKKLSEIGALLVAFLALEIAIPHQENTSSLLVKLPATGYFLTAGSPLYQSFWRETWKT